jgi:LCP family protein required for cell wall assembly
VTLPPQTAPVETAAPDTPPPTAAPTGTPLPTPSRGPEWNGTERLNILLIGADRREGDRAATYLTDTLMVASIDPVTKRVALISIPRDMEGVPLPPEWPAHDFYGGAYPGKINTLYTAARPRADLFPGGANQRGFTAVKGALSELYGLDVRYYIAVDLNGFRTVVDRLGGVVIDVQVPVADDHYGTNDGRGHINLYIPSGVRHMDGGEALAYARARHQTSDFDRAARQQNVVVALRQQTDLSSLLAPGVLEGLFQAFKDAVRTDIPPELFPRLVSLAQEVDLERRVSLVLTPPTYGTECYPCPPDGQYVLRANVPAIRRAVQNVFTTDPAEEERREKLAAEAALVHVLNGSTDPRLAIGTADQLDALGVNAIVPPIDGGRADRSTYTEPVVTVYNGAAEAIPETVSYLEESFGVSAVEATDPSQAAQVVVVVGSETPDLAPPD